MLNVLANSFMTASRNPYAGRRPEPARLVGGKPERLRRSRLFAAFFATARVLDERRNDS